MPTLPIAKLVENSIDDADARRLIDWIRWWRPLRITRRAAGGFRHPWDITASWRADKNRWEITVEPGYVNAAEVEVAASTLDALPAATTARDPEANPWLSERPSIPIPERLFRSIDGAAGGESIPPFFARMGVRTADTVTQSEFGLTTSLGGTLEDRAQARLLRAVDILVEQPRARVETVIERGPGGIAQLVANLTTPADTAPRLVLRRDAYDPAPLPGTIQALLASGAADEGRDRLKIGTLYLVSPPGAASTAAIDGSWQAVPVNRTFWNLSHALTREIGVIPPFRMSLGVPLAGGVAQGIIDAQVNAYAAADAAAAAFLSRATIRGRFWTV